MSIFKGAAVAIITPFNEDGSINFEEFGKLIDYQIDNGTDAIVVCGTTGEASTMTHEEHIETVRFCVQHTNKRVPVIAGTSSNCTETAVYLTKEAEKAGADAALICTPYYNKATQNGMFAHYQMIAKNSDLPIVLYNIPGRTGCNLTAETIRRLCTEIDTVVAIKDATDNFNQMAQMMHLCRGDIDLYSGNDNQVLPILSLGGIGVISVLSHVAPKDTHDMVMKFLEGDTKTAIDLQLKYIPLINALFSEVNPIPAKKACEFMGFKTKTLRMPLTEMEPAHAAVLREEMIKAGIRLA